MYIELLGCLGCTDIFTIASPHPFSFWVRVFNAACCFGGMSKDAVHAPKV